MNGPAEGTVSVAQSEAKLLNQALLGGAVLSIALAVISYRYLARVGPVPPTVARNRFLHPWVGIHAVSAATALLLGPFQFLPAVRRRWPNVHRWTGRTYVVSYLIGGSSALVLAAGLSSGVVAGAGFATLGVGWIYVTARGWHTARANHFSEHARWMTRSFALTFSAVTPRVYIDSRTVEPRHDERPPGHRLALLGAKPHYGRIIS